MRFRALVATLAAAALLVGCGTTTKTVTHVRPPSLGLATGEAKDAIIPTKAGYKPPHGNAEKAVFRTGGGCGTERWSVKTLTDPLANNVTLTPQASTIADLVSIAPPVGPTDRVNPTEETTFQITGKVIVHKTEGDSDIHLALEDAQGNHMIVEAASPSCAQGSVVLKQIEEVRPVAEATQVGKTVTVTGVGFFDRLHGQSGVAPNGIELHPVLSIK